MTELTPTRATLGNAAVHVLNTALGMLGPSTVSLGAWGEVYGGAFWPVVDAAVPDIATDAWFHLRHEP